MVSPLTPPPSDPAVAPPARRPGSVRRTSTMLMFWPDGLGTDLHLKGRARDLLTPADGEPDGPRPLGPLRRDRAASVTSGRIEADPGAGGLDRLVGCRAGGEPARGHRGRSCPTRWPGGTPLHLLLDDLAGSTLISGFVYVRWMDRNCPECASGSPRRRRSVACVTSARASGPARAPCASDGSIVHNQNTAHPAPLGDPADPLGWHELDDPPVPAMRRARRIDIWDEDGVLGIDAMFRDSAWDPDGQEVVVHEYQMLGRADRATGRLLSVEAVPRVLPYCGVPRGRAQRVADGRDRSAVHAHRGARALAGHGLLHPPQRRAALAGRSAGARRIAARVVDHRRVLRRERNAGDAEGQDRRRRHRGDAVLPAGRVAAPDRARAGLQGDPRRARRRRPRRSRTWTGSPSTRARATRPRWPRSSVCPRCGSPPH